MKKITFIIIFMMSIQSYAESPTCDVANHEIYVGWPTNDPVFELCYLAPNRSSATDGSSLEIRNVYFNGILAIERSHIPMLFAEYNDGTCYRDWKNTNSEFLRANSVESPTRSALTTCDVSISETAVVGNCPFADLSTPDPNDKVGSPSDCFSGVQVEKYADRMILTSNHSADWYKYSSRYTFYLDGRIAPRFGYGNSTGTMAGTTHFHHSYWRVNFDIDGPDNDQVFIDDTVKTTEFADLRSTQFTPNWSVIDSVTGRGYRVEATPEDYLVSGQTTGNSYHETDVMATKYKLVNGGTLTEYSDTPGQNNLLECAMAAGNLVNGESLVDEDVVFWYRSAVQDLANVGLQCKFAGPVFYPVGDWGVETPQVIYKNGFELQ